MKKGRIGVIGAAILLAAGAAGAAQQSQGERKIEAHKKEPVGNYLTDEQGRSVYIFKADSKNNATCYDACAQAWPPVVTRGEPQAGEGAERQMLGTIERKDGSRQVTYNGWPLYYFVKDKQPGDINGQDVNAFGAEWYLLTPQGQVAEAEGGKSEKG
jgi:predicted lipoprotein with Yx(FWY)xxD motif